MDRLSKTDDALLAVFQNDFKNLKIDYYSMKQRIEEIRRFKTLALNTQIQLYRLSKMALYGIIDPENEVN
jgi:hypothetical protein